jgi:hypothetical protein
VKVAWADNERIDRHESGRAFGASNCAELDPTGRGPSDQTATRDDLGVAWWFVGLDLLGVIAVQSSSMADRSRDAEHRCDECGADVDAPLPDRLIEDAHAGKVLLFVGSGASTEAHNVLGRTFYDEIRSEVGSGNEGIAFPDLMSDFVRRFSRAELCGALFRNEALLSRSKVTASEPLRRSVSLTPRRSRVRIPLRPNPLRPTRSAHTPGW